MKKFELTQDLSGIPKGTILTGPLPILGQNNLGYYTPENLPSAPSDQAVFASAVENNPSIFKEVVNKETSNT